MTGTDSFSSCSLASLRHHPDPFSAIAYAASAARERLRLRRQLTDDTDDTLHLTNVLEAG